MGESIGLEDLKVWKRAVGLVKMVYEQVLPALPVDEKWVLANQLRRAVQSVPANIAEGYGRYYYQDNVRFCMIARGSLDEVYNHVTVGKELGFLNELTYMTILGEIVEIRKMLNGYVEYVKKRKHGEGEPGSTVRVTELSPDYFLEADQETPFVNI